MELSPEKKETPAPGGPPQHLSPSLRSQAVPHDDENGESVIASIRATGITLGRGRLPAGFYIAVHHSDLEWRTENKRLSVNDDVTEWSGPIPIPSDLSATVCIEIYASFELQPVLGSGEQLRTLTITVEQLLDHSEKDIPFTLVPKEGDTVSSCFFILVTVEQWKCESGDSSRSGVLDPYLSTAGLRGKLEDATNEGHSALSQYRKSGEKRDLERSIEQFEQALNVCPVDHPCRAAAQSNLAMAKFILYQIEDTNSTLEMPLSLYRNALDLRPVGHVDRPSTLIQLATVHFARFEKRRDEIERERAEAFLHETIELSPTESHEHRAATLMLQIHTRRRAGSVQADGQSSVQQESVSSVTDGVQLLHRFERFGDVGDLQCAIALLEELVGFTLAGDSWYRTGLANLGVASLHRSSRLGKLDDLDNAISALREAIDLTPPGHSDKPAHLSNLGNSLFTRFQRLGKLHDLENAISTLKDAVDLAPDGHPNKPACLNNLGSAFKARSQRLGRLADLGDAILMLKNAVHLAPNGHPNKSAYLNNLGNSFKVRFQRLGQLADLEDAISSLRDAVNLTPRSHPHKPACLSNLGNCLKVRFWRLGELSDLEDAISTLRDAVDLTPRGHPDKPAYLNNLGSSLTTHYERHENLSVLEDAISTLRDAVDLTPRGHPDKPARLTNLASSLKDRFERLGHLSDLEDAILLLRNAVDLTPRGHPNMPGHLNNLGDSLDARFEHLGELSDLEAAIRTLRDAVNLTPDGHPDKPSYLNNLGYCIRSRFRRFGELSDLEEAISTLKNAVNLTPHDHPQKPVCLNNLGRFFKARFERLGELDDLESAISRHRDAIDLTPDGHPNKPNYLNNLGICFKTRFERLQDLSDLTHAISMLKNAVDLTPQGHSHKVTCLRNLGTSFLTRFKHLGELSDLEDSISILVEAVDLTPDGRPDKPEYLSSLGSSLRARFDHLGELNDLEQAILKHKDAVALIPDGHPYKPACLHNLGNCLWIHFERVGDQSNLEQAISVYSNAASAPVGLFSDRFFASRKWISCARLMRHHSLIHAYSVALNLLPQLAWIGLPLSRRYSELTRGVDLVREAAATALDSGLLETAVEWLEEGRSIVWGELFQLRSSYEELSSTHPEHARRLQELSVALEHAGATREQSLSIFSDRTRSSGRRAVESLQDEVDRHRTLAIERDKLLKEIRSLPGFDRFLLHKEFSQLRASAHSGPVVILNAAETRCDALIIRAEVDHIIHVPLPNFTFKRSEGLHNMLERLLGHTRVIPCDEREGKSAVLPSISWEFLLSTLWKDVVKPILDTLEFSTPRDLSRIFWCPTGPFVFLPIHAAGLYDTDHSQPGHKVSDFVISSYIPTLSILALSANPIAVPSGDLRLLVVRQPSSDGLSQLPGVDTELEHIRAVIGNSLSGQTTLVESSIGTVEEVLSLMKEADWVHFACHGIQDVSNPTNSGLCLADQRRLKLRDIMALSRPNGGLAFLSACQTAMGDERLSDEAVHVAAGMLFTGYRGVVGTMWSISDKHAPDVARGVYEELFRNGTRPDYREAARALHGAIERLRSSGKVPFNTWLPFIHVGL